MNLSQTTQSELSSLLHQLTDKIASAHAPEERERELDRHLQAIRDSFRRISRDGENDVFVCYLMEKLEALAGVFGEASSRAVLPVAEHEFNTARLLLNAFGDGKRVYRFTWKVDPTQRLFDDAAWKRHFELVLSLAISEDVEVRTIFIAETANIFEMPNMRTLLDFYAVQKGFSAKAILSEDWNACVVDHAIPADCIEFGIIGDKLLYQARTYTPVSVGHWSKDAADIKRFTHFFESAWNTCKAAGTPSALPGQQVTLSQVMRADAAHERRHNAVHDSLARIGERLRTDSVA